MATCSSEALPVTGPAQRAARLRVKRARLGAEGRGGPALGFLRETGVCRWWQCGAVNVIADGEEGQGEKEEAGDPA